MKRILLPVTIAVLLALSVAILRAGEKNQITIDNFSFSPVSLTVSVGTTVTWINHDDVPHTTVEAEGKQFKSPVLDTDQKFSYTFTKAGTYTYFCSVHPKMMGKVVVQ